MFQTVTVLFPPFVMVFWEHLHIMITRYGHRWSFKLLEIWAKSFEDIQISSNPLYNGLITQGSWRISFLSLFHNSFVPLQSTPSNSDTVKQGTMTKKIRAKRKLNFSASDYRSKKKFRLKSDLMIPVTPLQLKKGHTPTSSDKETANHEEVNSWCESMSISE